MKMPETPQGWFTLVTSGAAAFLVFYGVHNYFTTDAEAQLKHEDLTEHTEVVEQSLSAVVQTLTEASNRAEINRSRRELKRIKFMLENNDLTAAARSDLEDDEKYYEDLISCIKSGQKFCDE